MPVGPKPGNMTVEPSGMSATTSSMLATTLFFIGYQLLLEMSLKQPSQDVIRAARSRL